MNAAAIGFVTQLAFGLFLLPRLIRWLLQRRRGAQVVAKALANPPAPNAALKRAMRRWRK
jgi:hypothetical protein